MIPPRSVQGIERGVRVLAIKNCHCFTVVDTVACVLLMLTMSAIRIAHAGEKEKEEEKKVHSDNFASLGCAARLQAKIEL